MKWTFPRQILVALLVIGWLASYPLVKYGNGEMIRAAIAGAALATLNVILGYAAIEYSIGKSATTFLKFVLGGMGVRLFGMAGILLLMLKVFGFHVVALVSSLGVCYVVFLTMEIIYIQKRLSTRQQG
jgi:hypothetical protein